MKYKISVLFTLAIVICLSCQSNSTKKKTNQKYIFFLHNKFVEENPDGTFEPNYGVRAEYGKILESFKNDGFVILSEKRPPKTNWTSYAEKVKLKIDSLTSLGVKPNDITIIGASKGGYIAQYISTISKNPNLNFVFIGSYQNIDLVETPEIEFCGNILNIYEKTDEYGVSALKRKEVSKLPIPHFKEIELNTGLKHGFLYIASDKWLEPCKMWANGNYELKPKSSK